MLTHCLGMHSLLSVRALPPSLLQSGVRIACAVIMLIAAIVGGYCSYQLKEQVQDSEMKQHIKKTVKQ